LNKCAVLLVEDDSNDIFLVERSFRKAGIAARIDSVMDGEIAVDYLTRRLETSVLPDLVILDLKLPKLNGLEVLEWIRQQPELAHLPVVMLTSSSERSDIDRATQLGVTAYALKPSRYDDLLKLITQIAETWLPQSIADRHLTGARSRGSDAGGRPV